MGNGKLNAKSTDAGVPHGPVRYRVVRTLTASAPPAELVARWRARGYWTDERLGWLLERAAELRPDHPAVIDEEQQCTYRDLKQRSDAIAELLLAAGIEAGHVVTWTLPNCIDAVALATAIWRVGAVSNPVVTIYRQHELSFILRQMRPFTVVAPHAHRGRQVAQEFDQVLSEIGHQPSLRLIRGGSMEGWRTIAPTLRLRGVLSGVSPAPAHMPCLVLYTSGSTADPKGAVHNSRSLMHEVRTMQREWALSREDRLFMASPLTHITGALQGMILPLLLGATNIVQDRWDPEKAADFIRREGATYMVGATTFLQGLLEVYARTGQTTPLRQFTCGGASVPPHLIETADRMGIAAYRVWGMTEFPTTTLASTADPLERRAATDGRRAEAVEVEAFDPQGSLLPAGDVGELWVRGPERMGGYVLRALNTAAVRPDGWLRTGDLGYVDDQGYVTITGRLKDIINRGGEKFAARDIEDLLARHPAVAESAVIGVPGGRLGERVCAAVILKEGASTTAELLKQYLDDQRMAKQKIPEEIRFPTALPRTAAGKVQKYRLIAEWDAE